MFTTEKFLTLSIEKQAYAFELDELLVIRGYDDCLIVCAYFIDYLGCSIIRVDFNSDQTLVFSSDNLSLDLTPEFLLKIAKFSEDAVNLHLRIRQHYSEKDGSWLNLHSLLTPIKSDSFGLFKGEVSLSAVAP